jgi:hypothetical protein
MGPKPIPNVKKVSPRSATVRDMAKSRMMSETAGVYTDVPKVLGRVSLEMSRYDG